jgi:hypothetical protein
VLQLQGLELWHTIMIGTAFEGAVAGAVQALRALAS